MEDELNRLIEIIYPDETPESLEDNPRTSYGYDNAGRRTTQTDALDQTTTTVFNIAGEQFDEDLGQYYLRARFYEPEIGRFTRRDTYEGRLRSNYSRHFKPTLEDRRGIDMSLFPKRNQDLDWFCPLLNKEIEDGYCYDVNYQRLGYFKPDVLLEVKSCTGKSTEQISQVCENCPNNPFQIIKSDNENSS